MATATATATATGTRAKTAMGGGGDGGGDVEDAGSGDGDGDGDGDGCVLDQSRSVSCEQPVPCVQPASNSAAVHSRPPTLAQNDMASS